MPRAGSVVSLVAVYALVACAEHQSENRALAEPRIAATIGDLSVINPIAAEPVTGETGVLYFSVRNDGTDADTLLEVTADVALHVTLHNQVSTGGAGMGMVPVDHLLVPGSSLVSLRPGSYHVMLSELTRHYREGDSLTIITRFAVGGEVTFRVPVVSYVDVAEHTQVHP